jgi:HPt (histidine-containing phosphotransfer) domain-containing protein
VKSNTLSNQYRFDEKIDSDYLFSLYTDDYVCIQDVFTTALQHFDADFESFQMAWSGNSIPDLKRAVHKLKPTFGFTGMRSVEAACKQFEDTCRDESTTAQLSGSYKAISSLLLDAKAVLESECKKLKEFNAIP